MEIHSFLSGFMPMIPERRFPNRLTIKYQPDCPKSLQRSKPSDSPSLFVLICANEWLKKQNKTASLIPETGGFHGSSPRIGPHFDFFCSSPAAAQ